MGQSRRSVVIALAIATLSAFGVVRADASTTHESGQWQQKWLRTARRAHRELAPGLDLLRAHDPQPQVAHRQVFVATVSTPAEPMAPSDADIAPLAERVRQSVRAAFVGAPGSFQALHGEDRNVAEAKHLGTTREFRRVRADVVHLLSTKASLSTLENGLRRAAAAGLLTEADLVAKQPSPVAIAAAFSPVNPLLLGDSYSTQGWGDWVKKAADAMAVAAAGIVAVGCIASAACGAAGTIAALIGFGAAETVYYCDLYCGNADRADACTVSGSIYGDVNYTGVNGTSSCRNAHAHIRNWAHVWGSERSFTNYSFFPPFYGCDNTSACSGSDSLNVGGKHGEVLTGNIEADTCDPNCSVQAGDGSLAAYKVP